MIPVRLAICFVLILVQQHAVHAQWLTDPSVNGHVKSLDIAYGRIAGTPFDSGFFSANNQRVELRGKVGENARLDVALDNLLLYSSDPGQVALPADSPNRAVDLEHDRNRGDRWSDRIGIDRMAIHGSNAIFDWSVGRQAIGFGRIVIFSPLDVVAPFAPDALDTDIRPGIDALRAVHYFGLGGQVGATAVFGDEPDDNSYLATFSDNRRGIDMLAIGGSLRDRAMIGAGLAGSLGTLGVKIEASAYEGLDVGTPRGDLHDQFVIGAVELWYRFDSGIVLLTQYLFNGAGADTPGGYPAAAVSAATAEGLTYLLGQQYLMLGPSWEFHPLASLSGLVIWNLEDDSALVRPQLQVSLGDNLSLDLFYSFNTGESPHVLGAGIIVPRSEFGTSADSGGLLLRWYF